MSADFVEIGFKPSDIIPDLLQLRKNQLRLLGNMEAPKPHQNDLQVGVKSVGRDGNDLLGKTVFVQIAFFSHDQFVVDVFGRNVHQSEIESLLIGQNVFF